MYPDLKKIACRARERVFLLALFPTINFFTCSCPSLFNFNHHTSELCVVEC